MFRIFEAKMWEDLAVAVASSDSNLKVQPEYLGFLRRDDGWSDPHWERGADWCVLYFIERGEVRLIDGKQSVTCAPGEGLFVGGHAKPAVFFGDTLALREVWFRLDPWPAEIRDTEVLTLIRTFRAPVEAVGLVDHLAAEHPVDDAV